MKQNNMKRSNILLASLIILTGVAATFTSCAENGGTKPEDKAIAFLNAYFATDYATAENYCTQDLSEFLSNSVKDLNSLTDSVKSMIKRHTAYYKPQINSVTKVGKGDTAVVYYTIVKSDPADSLATNGEEQLIESRLSLVKLGEEWKVAALNEL